MLEMPAKIESVEELKDFMDSLHKEMDDIRAQHKENMKKMSDYFLFMAKVIDGALWSNEPDRLRKVLETTRDNLTQTAKDILQ